MKKRKYFYLILILLLLCACDKKKEHEEDNREVEEYVPSYDGNKQEDQKEGLGKEGGKEEDGEEEEYIPGYDDNRREYRIYDIEDSCLYVSSNTILCCIELETGNSYPVCSKPNCLHNSSECNAYTSSIMVSAYQDQLFTALNRQVYSYRMDGSGGEMLGEFEEYVFENVARSGGSCMVHRGYIYLGYCKTTATKLTSIFLRIPVSGGDVEFLHEESYPITGAGKVDNWEDWYLDDCYGIGSKVYFAIRQGKTGSLYCYDTNSGKVSLIHETTGGICQIYPSGGKWYWRTADGMKIICWNPKTEEESCIYTYPRASGGGNGIIYTRFYRDGFSMLDEAENPRLFLFYNWEGECVEKIEISSVQDPTTLFPEGHIENYMVCTYKDAEERDTVYALLDTDRLDDPSLEWMLFRIEK